MATSIEYTEHKDIDAQMQYIINNSVWLVFADDFPDHVGNAIHSFVTASEEDKHIDILGRKFIEVPAGDVFLRVTEAHYRPNYYIISEHTKGNCYEPQSKN